MILDFYYHGYSVHKNSQYRYITISVETLEGGGGVSVNLLFTFFIEFFFFTQRT